MKSALVVLAYLALAVASCAIAFYVNLWIGLGLFFILWGPGAEVLSRFVEPGD